MKKPLELRKYFNEVEADAVARALADAEAEPNRMINFEIRDSSRVDADNERIVVYVEPYFLTAKWYRRGRLHRTGGPADLIFARESGRVQVERWYQHGKLHREDGPACLRWSAIDDLEQNWYRRGRKHRRGAPAQIVFDGIESLRTGYYEDGKLHRLDGPANIEIIAPMYINEIHALNDVDIQWVTREFFGRTGKMLGARKRAFR